VPITQQGSSSSLSLPFSVSSSSSSSPSSPLSELGRSLRLSLIPISISSNVFSGFLDVNPASSACVISSCSRWTAASASSTRFLAPAVSLSTKSSIHFSFSSSLKKCVSGRFSAASHFLISSSAIPQRLGLSLPWSRSCFHSLDDVVGLSALLIFRFCQPEVAKSSFSEHWPLTCAWTVLLGEMFDVASYGQYGGKLRPVCQTWDVYSSWTKQNLPPDCQKIRNSDVNRTTWPDC